MTHEGERKEEQSCIVHDHPVPPEEIGRYSPVRDYDAEQEIARYVEVEANESVKHVEKIKEEFVLGTKYEIWDVTSDNSRWWVITNLTNLYSQKHFPSLDYTLSFHIGLMARISARQAEELDREASPFDELSRRQQQNIDRLFRAIEPEEFQAVGLQTRETLLALLVAMRQEIEIEPNPTHPKSSDFINWFDLLMAQLCPGAQNKQLRHYLKSLGRETWQLVNWLTHDRNANKAAASITAHATDTLIGHAVSLVFRKDDELVSCPRCNSRHVRSHYDPDIPPEGEYYSTCGACGWSNHPTGLAEA